MGKQELLECIAPYYPYRLNVLDHRGDICEIVSIIGCDPFYEVKQEDVECDEVLFRTMSQNNQFGTSGMSQVKYILRPLSDLTKPCLEGGKVPIEELEEEIGVRNWCEAYYVALDSLIENVNSVRISELIQRMPYEFIKIFLKWHFDIHNLIEQGYAIDINTLKSE